MGIESLIGETLIRVTGAIGDDEMVFETASGRQFRMWHDQGCCESVTIEDICGDLSDLIGSPVLRAEESVSRDAPSDADPDRYADSETWTFYKIDTAKGGVTIRWLGSSNGYYSESVEFGEFK